MTCATCDREADYGARCMACMDAEMEKMRMSEAKEPWSTDALPEGGPLSPCEMEWRSMDTGETQTLTWSGGVWRNADAHGIRAGEPCPPRNRWRWVTRPASEAESGLMESLLAFMDSPASEAQMESGALMGGGATGPDESPWREDERADPNWGRTCLLCDAAIRSGGRMWHQCPGRPASEAESAKEGRWLTGSLVMWECDCPQGAERDHYAIGPSCGACGCVRPVDPAPAPLSNWMPPFGKWTIYDPTNALDAIRDEPASVPPWTATADRTALVKRVQALEKELGEAQSKHADDYTDAMNTADEIAEMEKRLTLADESADAAVRNVAQLAADLARMTEERDEAQRLHSWLANDLNYLATFLKVKPDAVVREVERAADLREYVAMKNERDTAVAALAEFNGTDRKGWRDSAKLWELREAQATRQRDLLRGVVDQAVRRIVEQRRVADECIVRLRECEDELAGTQDSSDRWRRKYARRRDDHAATVDELAGTVEANRDLQAENAALTEGVRDVARYLLNHSGKGQAMAFMVEACGRGPDALLKLAREG